MPTIDDPGLDPQRRERIRSRALERGSKMRRRRTIARRSVTATAVVVFAGGGVLIARAAGVATSAPPAHKITVGGSTTTVSRTPPTLGGTSTTTIPFTGGSGTTGIGASGTTGSRGSTTTTTTTPVTTTAPPPTTTVTTTTVPAPVGTSFQKSLTDVVAPGTLGTATWTVPAKTVFELSKFTISAGSSKVAGDIRAQLQSSGSPPQTLFEVDFGQLGSPFEVSLATPAPFQAGEQLALTATCVAHQPACTTTLSFSGELWTTGPFDHAYANSLSDVVAPGEKGWADWTVPSGRTFSLSDLVLSATGSELKGEVYVQTVSGQGGPTSTIFHVSLASLERGPVHASGGSLTLSAGTQLQVTVTCGLDQSACSAALLFTGHLT